MNDLLFIGLTILLLSLSLGWIKSLKDCGRIHHESLVSHHRHRLLLDCWSIFSWPLSSRSGLDEPFCLDLNSGLSGDPAPAGKAAWGVHGPGLYGRACPSGSCTGSGGTDFYRLSGIDPQAEMTWKTYAVAMLLFNVIGLIAVYALQRLQAMPATQPAGTGRSHAGFRLEYGGQFCQQHQLAELQRRDDHELSHADAWHDGAELCFGGDRHGGAGGFDPRDQPPYHPGDRQLLGGHDPLSVVYPPAAFPRAGSGACLPGCRANIRSI